MSKTQEIIQEKIKMLQYDSNDMTYTKEQVIGFLDDILVTHGRELFNNMKDKFGYKPINPPSITIIPIDNRQSIADIMDDAERDARNGVAAWRYSDYLDRIWKSYVLEKTEERKFIKDLIDELEPMWNIIPSEKNHSFLERLNRIIFKVKNGIIGKPPRTESEELIREWQKDVYKKTGNWIEPETYEDATERFAEWLVNKKGVRCNND